ncbi:MAG: 2-oxoglutarate dehydrogenase E1 component, partial [Gammaproteobacteria bacterium]|nr:2-oxoglutarate dehydrogenase E1 component [Gammaproteobacteria bacterium]
MAATTKTGMSELWESSAIYGESAAWLESMYETYLSQPDQLEEKWRLYFDGLPAKLNGRGSNGSAVEKLSREISPRETHNYFLDYAQIKHARGFAANIAYDHEKKQVQVLQLINAYRFRGHQVANLNPLGGRRENEVAELSLAYHGLSESDLDTVFETGSLAAATNLPLKEIHQIVQQTYCGTIGTEYMHIMETAEKRWIQ